MCTEEEVFEEAQELQKFGDRLVGPRHHLTRRDRRCFPGTNEHDVEAVITGKIIQAITEGRQVEDTTVSDELLPIILKRRLKMNPSVLLQAILQDEDAVLIVLLEKEI
jgi:hypothetical protein